ncbi:hypothetical protein Tco_1172253 [Tanacetum coccineum]
MGTSRFGNDHFAAITSYGDYVHGNVKICHVYYVEGLCHNLFSVGQFCDGDHEVAFYLKMYFEDSRGFRIYNRRTRKIMETIHVTFDELTAMASKHNSLEPDSNRMVFEDPSAEPYQTPTKKNLDDLFGPLYDEYFKGRTPKCIYI